MASFDEEIRLDEEENRRELAYIRTQLPSDVKKFYSDKDILYMMDLIVDRPRSDCGVCVQAGKGRGLLLFVQS